MNNNFIRLENNKGYTQKLEITATDNCSFEQSVNGIASNIYFCADKILKNDLGLAYEYFAIALFIRGNYYNSMYKIYQLRNTDYNFKNKNYIDKISQAYECVSSQENVKVDNVKRQEKLFLDREDYENLAQENLCYLLSALQSFKGLEKNSYIYCRRKMILGDFVNVKNEISEMNEEFSLLSLHLGLFYRDSGLLGEVYRTFRSSLIDFTTVHKAIKSVVDKDLVLSTAVKNKKTFFNLYDWKYIFRSILVRKKPVLISTISKSASTYIPRQIAIKMAAPNTKIFQEFGAEYNVGIIEENIKKFADRGGVARQHFRPTDEILSSLSRYGIRKVLFHVRNPIEAVVSWYFYQESVLHKFGFPSLSPMYADSLSAKDYANMSEKQKVDYHVRKFIPRTMQMIDEWVIASRTNQYGIEVKITKFEDMKRDQEGFMRGVFQFFALGKRDLSFLNKLYLKVTNKRPITKKRKGTQEEWKSLLTNESLEYIKKFSTSNTRLIYPDV